MVHQEDSNDFQSSPVLQVLEVQVEYPLAALGNTLR